MRISLKAAVVGAFAGALAFPALSGAQQGAPPGDTAKKEHNDLKKIGGNISRETKKAGRNINRAVIKGQRDTKREAHRAGKNTERETHRAGKNTEREAHRAGKNTEHEAQRLKHRVVGSEPDTTGHPPR